MPNTNIIPGSMTKSYLLIDTIPEEIALGDTIRFGLSTGEHITAKAMRQEADGMLFVFVDCLNKEYPMNRTRTNKGGYRESDLRKVLNTEILDTFPNFIKSRMKPVYEDDRLRLLTAMEVFGENPYGDEDNGEQISFMENIRDRIAFQGDGTSRWEWYWLQNVVKDSAANFANGNGDGGASYSTASNARGVRPAFKI